MSLIRQVVRSTLDEARYAGRLLASERAFSLVAILTLALGVGANSAIFSMAEAVMLRPLSYPASERLVSLWELHTGRGERMPVAIANLADYEGRTSSFEGLAGYASTVRTLTGTGAPEQLRGEAVSAGYFRTLDVRPAMGRPFRAGEDRSGAARIAILSNALWKTRFNADPSAIGQTVRLNSQPHEIVGIMAPEFRGLTDWSAASPAAFFIPAPFTNAQLTRRGDHEIAAVARLRSGVAIERAQADLDRVSNALAAEYSDSNSRIRARVAPLVEDVARDVRTSLIVLLGASVALLLIACISLANLLVARAVGRRREIALRLAFGASRGRVLLLVIMHGLLLAALGAVAGLVSGIVVRDVLVRWAPPTIPRLDEVSLNWRVLTVTSVTALAVAMLSSVFPAIQVLRTDAAFVLRASAATVTGSRAVIRWRAHLVSIQVAAALALAIAVGLMVRTLAVIHATSLGFASERVLTMTINLPNTRYPDPERRLAFFTALTERVETLPGVEAVAFANQFPMRGGWGGGIHVDNASGEPVEVDLQAVSPGYFSALQIPLLRGRLLTSGDRNGAPLVAVVSETFVRRFVPDGDAVGRQVRRTLDAPAVTIVGVVGEVRRGGKTAEMTPQVFLSAAQTELYPVRLQAFAVRTKDEPRALLQSIQRHVWAIDREQAVGDVRTLDEVLAAALAPRQFNLLLLTLFAAVSIALAIAGLYGVIAYATAQRAPEIAIRMSIGATPRNVLALVLSTAVRPVLVGVALGLIGALTATRVMKGLLFGVEALDYPTYLAMTAFLVAVAAAASVLPARRAMNASALTALRID